MIPSDPTGGMLVLALDSSTRMLGLALHTGAAVLAESVWETDGRHTVELTSAIQAMLVGQQRRPTDLRAVAVAQGPGSFNGLRVGFSVAKGLTYALNIPLIAIPTLRIVAAATPYFAGNLIAVAQAGRGRVVAETFTWEREAWHAMGNTVIVTWATLLSRVTAPTLFSGELDPVGRGAIAAYVGEHVVQAATPAQSIRRASVLAELALARLSDSEQPLMLDPAATLPLYLHQPGVPHP